MSALIMVSAVTELYLSIVTPRDKFSISHFITVWAEVNVICILAGVGTQ